MSGTPSILFMKNIGANAMTANHKFRSSNCKHFRRILILHVRGPTSIPCLVHINYTLGNIQRLFICNMSFPTHNIFWYITAKKKKERTVSTKLLKKNLFCDKKNNNENSAELKTKKNVGFFLLSFYHRHRPHFTSLNVSLSKHKKKIYLLMVQCNKLSDLLHVSITIWVLFCV